MVNDGNFEYLDRFLQKAIKEFNDVHFAHQKSLSNNISCNIQSLKSNQPTKPMKPKITKPSGLHASPSLRRRTQVNTNINSVELMNCVSHSSEDVELKLNVLQDSESAHSDLKVDEARSPDICELG